jgi:hypothetical protein
LVRLVGPGCIRYRECTQVHNIYRIAFYTLLLPPRLPRPTSPPTQPNHPCPLGPANRTIPLPPIPPEPNWFLPRFPHQIPFLAPEPCDDSRGWRRLRWRATAARVSGGDRGAVGGVLSSSTPRSNRFLSSCPPICAAMNHEGGGSAGLKRHPRGECCQAVRILCIPSFFGLLLASNLFVGMQIGGKAAARRGCSSVPHWKVRTGDSGCRHAGEHLPIT